MPEPTGPAPIVNPAEMPQAPSARSAEKRELPEDSPYKQMLGDIVASPRHYNEKQLQSWVLPAKMDELLDQIQVDTTEVLYTKKERAEGSNLISELPLTFDDLLLEQIEYAIADSDPANSNRAESKWDTHMTRQNGLRNAVATLLENERFRQPFIDAVRKRQAEIIRARDGVEGESKLTPEQFQKVAEDEGRVAVESAPVVIDFDAAAEAARSMVGGADAPSGVMEIPDFVRNPGGARPAFEAPVAAPVVAPEKDPAAPESELEMNERFLRETQAELRDLYAEHRAAAPGSYEQDSLANQIKHAKEDAGKFARKVAQLKGGNWT